MENRAVIKDILNLRVQGPLEKYLGVPSIIGRSKKEAFEAIKNRVWAKANSWKERYLSKAGKAIMIKSVFQSIPTYFMSVFRLTDEVCNSITSIVRRFWWGSKPDQRSLCWRDWDSLCLPKAYGGMGFRNIKLFNTALLAKQGWRLIQNPEALATKILKAKYYPHDHFLEAKAARCSSYTWRSIYSARELLNDGGCWRIGTGENIFAWGQKWIPSRDSGGLVGPPNREQQVMTVARFIDQTRREWNLPMLHSHLSEVDAVEISRIKLPVYARQDLFWWKGEKHGCYTVKSGYRRLNILSEARRTPSKLWKGIWHAKIPSKIQVFGWRLWQGILPTKAALARRGVNISVTCPVCDSAPEDVDHCFTGCEWARKAWNSAGLDLEQIRAEFGPDVISCALEGKLPCELDFLLVLLWMIWNHRNEYTFRGRNTLAEDVGYRATGYLSQYQQASVKDKPRDRSRCLTWEPPEQGVLKINCDGSFKLGENAGFGTVIRDSEGVIWGAMAGSSPACQMVEEIEVVAICEGLRLAKELNCTKVVVETDCSEVVKEITSGRQSLALYGDIIYEINEIAASFDYCSFQHNSRTCNKLADRLAFEGYSTGLLNKWVYEIPLFLADVIS